MHPLVSVLLILLAVCALGVTAGLFDATVRALISRKSKELTDDRVKIRAIAEKYANRKPRLLDMTREQRVDAQRALITRKVPPHAVEFTAALTREYVETLSRIAKGRGLNVRSAVDGHGTSFAGQLERHMQEFFPLGGHTTILPFRESVTNKSFTVHAIVHMSARDKVDAHEVAQRVCSDIMSDPVYQNMYQQVIFFPVRYPRVGCNPGLWTRTTSRSDEEREYLEVKYRDSAPAMDEAIAATKGNWTAARDELRRITDEFVAFEFSPVDVAFTRRLLWDLTEPATARFYEAFDAANILLTDTEPDSSSAAQQFIEASRVAVAAWEAADRNARDKAEQNIVSGNQVLTEDRVKHRDTALAAMNLALDPSSGDYEVGTALAHSLKALDRAGLPIPPSKLKKLESNELVARAMRALPAGNG